MSGEWVHPGQTLIWAVWVLAAATEGETPSGRGGFSEDRVGGFPCLGGFSTGGMKLSLRGLRGPAEGSIVTWGHLINVPALLEAPGPEPPAGAHGRSTENPSAALGLPVPCGGGGVVLGEPSALGTGEGVWGRACASVVLAAGVEGAFPIEVTLAEAAPRHRGPADRTAGLCPLRAPDSMWGPGSPRSPAEESRPQTLEED